MSIITRLNGTYGTSFLLLVLLGYFTQGLRCFPWTAMSYWYKDTLKVDPGQMQFLMSTATLPMVAKPVYGIISDSVYIKGAHRVPYLIIAGALQLFAWTAIVVHSGASSSAAMLTAFLTITNLGGAISEVVNDAMIAEAGKNKVGAQQGELQSFAWLALASGGVVGNLTAGYAMKVVPPQVMLAIFIILIATQLLLALTVSEHSFALGPIKKDTDDNPEQKSHERQKDAGAAMREQITKLKESLQKPEIFKPLLWFLSSYAVIPGLGSALFYYQTQYLRLGASVIGLARVIGQVGLLFGSMLYNKCLKDVPIRRMFATVQILLSLCMLTDILLVNRINLEFGIPDKWFVLGASAFVEAIVEMPSQRWSQRRCSRPGPVTVRAEEVKEVTQAKGLSRESGGQWLSCTTRHVRIYAGYVDPETQVMDQSQLDKLTLMLDPDNEFEWPEEMVEKVYDKYRELVETYAGADLTEYTLRLIGSDLEHYIRKLLLAGELKYNLDCRVLNFSMGKPRIDPADLDDVEVEE